MKWFKFEDKNDIATLSDSLKIVNKQYPIIIKFLEKYCGYNTPLNSSNPQEICYSQGKRDVILTIKTLMRDDITSEQIAQFYKNIGV